MKYPRGGILQFAKTPELGKVKTRLIPAIGAEKALGLHRQLLAQTLNTCLSANLCQVELWLSEPTLADGILAEFKQRDNPLIGWQQGDNLGERMAHAVKNSLERYDFVILVGSDCPAIDREYLELAIEHLINSSSDTRNRAVIGPAEDGGYVLIGLRQFDPLIFEEIDWGSSRVLRQTLTRLGQLDWHVHELPVLWDVDRPQDLKRLAGRLPGF